MHTAYTNFAHRSLNLAVMLTETAFSRAVTAAREFQVRPEISLTEAPPPRRMAPETWAVTAEVDQGDDELGTGRFVALYNPAGEAAWEGSLRIVIYVDALVEAELASDSLLPEIGWTWLSECLRDVGVEYWALGGTVTRVQSESFESMGERGTEGRVQIRASWTGGNINDLQDHLEVWTLLLAAACGLTPTNSGVSVLPRR